jgi:NAD(P)-dependent dehydrogenase (short-subunit alcohol dehydrogenase family)
MKPDFSLTGKVALVSGSTRGLGNMIARTLAHAGADVVISGRHQDKCEQVASEIARETGRRVLPIACHVGHWDEISILVSKVENELGPIGVLVNSAGIAPTYPSLTEVSEELFDKVIAVNLKGPFRLCALVGKAMMMHVGGSIINISSVASERPRPYALPYSASKAGLDALTRGFAQAFGPKVRVNGIMAGRFGTGMSESWNMSELSDTIAKYPLGRAGQPSEITGAVLYLASEAGSYVTGSIIGVDGGMRLV